MFTSARGERDALLLSARELARFAASKRSHLDHLERLADPPRGLVLVDTLLPEPVRDVLGNRHVREEGVVLEDRVHVPLVRWHALHVRTGDADVPLVGLLEAGQHPQRRRLAAPTRPEQGQELARLHLQAQRVNGHHRAEALGHVGELDRAALPRHAVLMSLTLRSCCSRCVHLAPCGPRAQHGDIGDLVARDRADVGRERA